VLDGDAVSLSGDPRSARSDLVELGRSLVSRPAP
jgi:hypothetical protein